MKTKKSEKVERILNTQPASERAKGVKLPLGNPLLKAAAGASTDKLPANLLEVFAQIRARAEGIKIDILCPTDKPSGRYARWLVRQLVKRKLVNAIPEKKPIAIAKKSAKKAQPKNHNRQKAA